MAYAVSRTMTSFLALSAAQEVSTCTAHSCASVALRSSSIVRIGPAPIGFSGTTERSSVRALDWAAGSLVVFSFPTGLIEGVSTPASL